MKTIKYCCRNERFGSGAVYKSLKEQFPDVKQKKKDCLGNCKLCRKQSFARVGKKNVVCAQSADELYAQLRQLIEQGAKEKVMA